MLARPAEIESTTFWSVAKRSIQLSYGRIFCTHEIHGAHNILIQNKEKSNT